VGITSRPPVVISRLPVVAVGAAAGAPRRPKPRGKLRKLGAQGVSPALAFVNFMGWYMPLQINCGKYMQKFSRNKKLLNFFSFLPAGRGPREAEE
jgi:hypothetical protein